MKKCPHPDCNDKDSTHYFMCHMTQEEFEYMRKGIEIRPYEFNMIRGNVTLRDPFKKSVTFEKGS